MAIYKDVASLEVVGYTEPKNGTFSDGVQFILEKLDAIPEADVEPVRRGHWILEANHRFSDWGYCDVYVDMKCSRCGKPWHDGNIVGFTTLPNYDENEMPYPITEQRIKDADQRCFQEAKEIAKKYMSCELCGAKMDEEVKDE